MNDEAAAPMLSIASGFRLQWEPAQEAHVLLYPEGMIKLNPAAAEILKRCDGTLTEGGVIAALQEAFPDADLESDVKEFVAGAMERGWLKAS